MTTAEMPCTTTDKEGKPHTGTHKWEWMNDELEPKTYFSGQRCKNCGAERPAPEAQHD